MIQPQLSPRVLLIGGSSHVGKTTLAQALATHLGWDYLSTDKLARHPGRPWQPKPKIVPEHVADHYLSLSPEELLVDVLHHYRENVWSIVAEIVASHASDPTAEKLVLEGSAILPELVAELGYDHIASIWLTAGDAFFTRRISASSHYETKTAHEKKMIDQFLQRSILFNQRTKEMVKRLDLPYLNVEITSKVEDLKNMSLSIVKINM